MPNIAFKAVEAPALGDIEHEAAIDEGLGLGIDRDGAEAVDGHQEIRSLDVGAVRGRDGERGLIEKEIGKARAVEPILQGALAALPLLDAFKRDLRLRARSAAA